MAVMCAVVEHGTDHHHHVNLPEHCPQLSSPEAVMARLDMFKAPAAVIVKYRVPSTPTMSMANESNKATKTNSSSSKKRAMRSPRSTTAHTETKSIKIASSNQKKNKNKSSRRMRSILQREEDLDTVVSEDLMVNVFEDQTLDGRLSGSFHLLMNLVD